MSGTLNDKLLTSTEIAKMLSVAPAEVSNYKRRHANFPEPAFSRGVSKLYLTEDVLEWIANERGGLEKSAKKLEQESARLLNLAKMLREHEAKATGGTTHE